MGPLAGPPESGTVAIAAAALRAWVRKLHQVLAGTGVYAAHVPIFAWIGSGGRKPSPGPSPGAAGTSTASGTAPGIPTTPGDIAAHPRKEPT